MTHAQFGHSFGHADIKYSGHFSGAKQIKFMHIYMHKAVKGLSLHLNHLIAWRAGISFRQFGTLPIGFVLSNLDSRHLMTSPRTLLGQF